MQTDHPDGVNDTMQNTLRTGLMVAAQLAEVALRMRASAAHSAQQAHEQYTRQFEARLRAQAQVALRHLQPVRSDRWWRSATPADIADRWHTAMLWEEREPAARDAADHIARQLHERFAIDVHDLGADPTAVEAELNRIEQQRQQEARQADDDHARRPTRNDRAGRRRARTSTEALDELLPEATRLIVAEQYASPSVLVRRMVGVNAYQAAALIDAMEKAGVVIAATPDAPRRVRFNRDQLAEALAQLPVAPAGQPEPGRSAQRHGAATPGSDASRVATAGRNPAPTPGDVNPELLRNAARYVVERQHASTVLLGRKLGLKFEEADRLVDALQAAGIVGPKSSRRPRQVRFPADRVEDALAAVDRLTATERGHEPARHDGPPAPATTSAGAPPEPEWVTTLDPQLRERLEEATRLVVDTQFGSIPMLERRMGVGFADAGRLMAAMEQAGIVEVVGNDKARDVRYATDRVDEAVIHVLGIEQLPSPDHAQRSPAAVGRDEARGQERGPDGSPSAHASHDETVWEGTAEPAPSEQSEDNPLPVIHAVELPDGSYDAELGRDLSELFAPAGQAGSASRRGAGDYVDVEIVDALVDPGAASTAGPEGYDSEQRRERLGARLRAAVDPEAGEAVVVADRNQSKPPEAAVEAPPKSSSRARRGGADVARTLDKSPRLGR